MSQHVVIIGAVALGPKAACRFKRLEPGSRVTMIDQSDRISYGGCGIPYYVSGDVSDITELQKTSFHMIRDVPFFKDVKGIDARPRTRAILIDRDNKQVTIENLDSGETEKLDYDKLVIATGSMPRKLPIPGSDLNGVHCIADLDDAEAVRGAVSRGEVNRAVIVGAGFIGLEMAEALADMWGLEVSVVEITNQILPNLVSPSLARMARKHMEDNGVQFHLGETVERIEGDGRVSKVVTSGREIEAELVIMSAGVIPNDKLAREAGLEVSERGGIIVDEQLRTSDPDIFSGGDCILSKNLITGQPAFLPLGSMSNRQGRIIGNNLAGGSDKFDGVVGSFAVKMFEMNASGTGMSLETAKRAGFDAMSVMMVQIDRAHFYPDKELMTLEIVVEKGTRKILGVQGIGEKGDALVGKINAVAAILKCQPTLEALTNMELAYSPPFASAMDILNCLGNVAENVLDGINVGITPDEFNDFWEKRDEDENLFFLDCRENGDAASFVERHSNWHNIPQGEIAGKLDQVPRDKKIILICNTGARSYEAQITLRDHGYEDVLNLQGGMAGLKKWKCDV